MSDKYKCVNDKNGKCKDGAGYSCTFSFGNPNMKDPTECNAYQTQEELDEFNKKIHK